MRRKFTSPLGEVDLRSKSGEGLRLQRESRTPHPALRADLSHLKRLKRAMLRKKRAIERQVWRARFAAKVAPGERRAQWNERACGWCVLVLAACASAAIAPRFPVRCLRVSRWSGANSSGTLPRMSAR